MTPIIFLKVLLNLLTKYDLVHLTLPFALALGCLGLQASMARVVLV